MLLLQYVELHPTCRCLGTTLSEGIPEILDFLVGVAPLYVGYCLFGTTFLGPSPSAFLPSLHPPLSTSRLGERRK